MVAASQLRRRLQHPTLDKVLELVLAPWMTMMTTVSTRKVELPRQTIVVGFRAGMGDVTRVNGTLALYSRMSLKEISSRMPWGMALKLEVGWI